MALFKFTRAILNGDTINVYNFGEMSRDFTYIDDLIKGMSLLIESVPKNLLSDSENLKDYDSISPVAPFRVVNIGNSRPAKLTDFINAIEMAVEKVAVKNFMPMQPGDVPSTWADTSLLEHLTNYRPETEIKCGVSNFVEWYRLYYNV